MNKQLGLDARQSVESEKNYWFGFWRQAVVAISLTMVASVSSSAGTFPEPWSVRDISLEEKLELTLSHVGLSEPVRAGNLSVAIADITDLNNPKYAAVNDEEMFYASSLPKIAILVGAFYKAERDHSAIPQDVYDDALKMIRVSNNYSATRVLAWVGNDYLVKVLESDELKLYDRSRNGGLWVGKGYANGIEYQRDPLHDTVHGANTLQITRFWYLIATGRIINPERSYEIKNMMGNPVFKNKFVKGLKSRPGLQIFRKTGTFKQYHADGALIEVGQGATARRYIMAALANDPAGGEWMVRMAQPLYDLLATSSHPPK